MLKKIILFTTLVSTIATAAEKPNILFFFVDDMGWQDTSVPFYTEKTQLNKDYRTPNMEKLAAKGLLFTNAYACNTCSPSRISLMTGQNAARHQVTSWTLQKNKSPERANRNFSPAPWPVNGLQPVGSKEKRAFEAVTLPEILRKNGYHTIHAGKAHFGAKDTPGADPSNLGFDVNIAGSYMGGPGSYHGDKNFSAHWRQPGNHLWDIPGLDKYHGQKINLTEAITREVVLELEKTVASKKPFYLYMSHYAVHGPFEADRRFLPNYKDEKWSKHRKKYASMIESMDRSLGDLTATLERLGVADNTIIIFMSDNGSPKENPRNIPLRSHKISGYEGGTRVPLIVQHTSLTKPNTRTDTPMIIEDIFPSILEMAGVKDIPKNDGVSFNPILKDTKLDRSERPLIWHYPNLYDQPPHSAIRVGDLKLIYWHLDQKLELFNLKNDLSEITNLAKKQPQDVKRLATILSNDLREKKALMLLDRKTKKPVPMPDVSLKGKAVTFSDSWSYQGIVANEPNWDLWGASPVMDDQGKVHLFVARWPGKIPFNQGWRYDSEIARYTADSPEGPFTYQETILKPEPKSDRWDRLGLHNPNIQRLSDGRYALTYIGRPARKGQPGNQRIGMVIADSLSGPWKPANGSFEKPILDVPENESIWCYKPNNGVCNPALLEMPNGKFHLYFKSSDGKKAVMGVAIADQLEGPYVFHKDPITKNNASIEDGYAFRWNDEVCFVTTDNHGMIEKGGGLLWRSKDGITFTPKPEKAFPKFDRAYLKGADRSKFKVHYVNNVKFERPQILLIDGQPAYMYLPCGVATDGSDGTNVHALKRKTAE